MIRNIKGLCALLAAALALSLGCLPVYGAGARVEGFGDRGLDGEIFEIGQPGIDSQSLTVHGGDEIRIPLTADMFTWSDDRTPADMQAVTTSQLRGVRVRANKIFGTATLDYLQLDTDTFAGRPFYAPTNQLAKTGRTAYISVMFARELAEVEDRDFIYEIYLTVNGEKSDQHSIMIAGTLEVDLVEVTAGDTQVDLSDGQVAEALDAVRDIELDTGNGLTLRTNLSKDTRYYAASRIVDSHFGLVENLPDLPELYPEIECLYLLTTVHVPASAKASITLPGAGEVTHHVYGEDLRYLGTTADVLDFSPMYILCSQRIPALEEIVYDNLAD